MKKIILLVIVMHFSLFFVNAQTEEEKSYNEFSSGQTNKYSSKGEGKSQGLKINIKYPKSWNSSEGERPHVIQKIFQSEGYVSAIILVTKQDKEVSQKEIDEFFTTEGLKTMLTENTKYISCNPNLKIEGLKAGSLEYTISGKRMDRDFYSYVQHYFVFYKQWSLTIQFIVTNKIGESNDSVSKRFTNAKSLFYMMFNSIVIDNIWEK